MVIVASSADTITQIDVKLIMFLILLGLATGESWICYFKALSVGDVDKVVPIDKMSILV